MPFLGQDWRSPGEQWVRTTEGWEQLTHWRLKLLEHLSESIIVRLISVAMAEEKAHESLIYYKNQPHIALRKTGRSSSENSIDLSIADAFKTLDITGAIKDTRRFNYVCKVLEIFLRHQFSFLSGSAQKVIVAMLENIFNQVLKTQNNKKIMQGLLDDLAKALKDGKHFHIGSVGMWKKHEEAREKMQEGLDNFEIRGRAEDGGVMMTDLPADCLRHICDCLADHQDLLNISNLDDTLWALTQDYVVWKRLCYFHFDHNQIRQNIQVNENLNTCDWEKLYFKLVKRHGMRDTYAEMLHLCRHCNTLFWNLHGHQCLVQDMKPLSIPILPTKLVELFNR